MSQTIDSRVVEMSFDNSKFEGNVNTSISTLGRLKNALNFDGMAKGLNDIDRAAQNVDFNQMSNSLSFLEKRFSTLGIVGMTAIQNLTNSALNFVKHGFGAVTDAIIGGGKRRAFNIENAHFQLQGLLNDEAKVKAIMDDAMESVDGTAYGYDEAAKAASQFAASGLKSGEQMLSALRAIAGTAAMANSDYESISRIFTSVAGAGRLMGNDLLQLSSRGLNAAATLADYFNKVNDGSVEARDNVKNAIKELSSGTKVTEGDIREFVTKGKLSFDIFSAAMDNAFGEHAKKANETVTGALSNVRAALGRIGAEFISPLIEQNGPLVNFLNALRVKINDVKAAIIPLATVFTTTVNSIFSAAEKFLNGLDIKPFLRNMNDILGLEKYFSHKDLIDMFTKDVVKDVDMLRTAFTGKKLIDGTGDPTGLEKGAKTYEAFKKVVTAVAKDHGIAIDDMIKSEGSFEATLKKGWLTSGIFNDAISKITDGKFSSGAKQTAKDLETIRNVAKEVIRGNWGDTWPERIERLTAEGFSEETISQARKYVNVLHKLTDGTWNLTDEILNKADAEMGSVETLGNLSDAELEAMGLTKEEIDLIREFGESASEYKTPVQSFIDSFKDGFKGAGSAIDVLKTAFDSLLSVTGVVRDFLFSLGKAVLPILANVGGRVAATFFRIVNAIGGFAKQLRKTLAENDTFNKVFSAITPVLERIANVINMLLEILGNFVEVGLEKLGQALPGVIDKVGKFFKTIQNTKAFKAVSGFFKGLYTTITSKLVGALDKENVSKFLDKVGEKSKTMFETVKKVASDLKLKEKFSAVGESLKTFWESLTAPDSEIRVKVEKKIEDIKNAIASFYDYVFHNKEGKNPWEAFKSWITENFDPVAIFEDIKTKIENATKDFDLSGALAAAKDKIKEFFTNIWDALTGKDSETQPKDTGEEGFLSNLKNSFLKKISDFFGKDFSLSGIMNVVEQLAKLRILIAGGGALNQLRKFLKNVRGLISDVRGVTQSLKHLVEAEAFKAEAESILDILKGIAIFIAALTAMIFIIGKMKPEEAEQGYQYMMSILKLVGGILIVIGILRLLKSDGGTASLGPLETIASGLSTAIRKFAKSAGRAMTIAAIGFAIAAIVKALILLTSVKWDEAGSAVVALVGIAGGLLTFMILLKTYDANDASVGTALTIAAIAIAIGILAKTVKKFGKMDFNELAQGLLAVFVLMTSIGAAIRLMGKAGSAGAFLPIIAMTAALVVIVWQLKKLAKMKPNELFVGVLAITAILVSLGLAIKLIGKTEMNKASVAGLVVLVGAILAITGSLYILSSLDTTSMLASALALAGVFTAVIGMVTILTKFGKLDLNSFGTIATTIALIVSITAALYVLSSIPFDALLYGVIALGAVFAEVAILVGVAGTLGTGAWPSLLAMAALVGVLGLVIYGLKDIEFDQVLPVVGSMLLFFGGMIAVLSIAGLIGIPLITGAIAIIAAMAVLIVGIAGLGLLLDAVMPAIEAGKNGFNKLGEAIGEFVGSLLNGILKKLAEGIGEFADALDSTNIDSGKLEQVKALFEMMSAIQNGLPPSGGLKGIIFGWKDLGNFGDDLVNVAKGMGEFGKVLGEYTFGGKNQSAMIDLCKDMATIQSNLPPSGGLKQKIDGYKNLGQFGNDLANVAAGMGAFGIILKIFNFGGDDQDAIIALCSSMVAIQNRLPAGGGFKQKVDGYKDLGQFGSDLAKVAAGMGEFGKVLGKYTFDAANIINVAMLGMFMASVQTMLPETGGVEQFWSGHKDLGKFGWDLIPVAVGMGAFATVLTACNFDDDKINAAKKLLDFLCALAGEVPVDSGFLGEILGGGSGFENFGTGTEKLGEGLKNIADSNFTEESLKIAQNALTFLKQLSEEVPADGGLLSTILGGGSGLDSFATNISHVGQGLGTFSENIKEIDQGNINTAITALNGIASISSTQGFQDSSTLDKFGDSIETLGKKLKAYCDSIAGVELSEVYNSVACVRELINAINDTKDINADGIGQFKDAVTQLGTTDVNGLLAPLLAQKDSITSATTEIASAFATGITSDTSGVTDAGGQLIAALIAGINEKIGEVTTTAETISENLYTGIQSKGDNTILAMTNIMKDTIQQITDKQDSFLTDSTTCAENVLTGLSSKNGQISTVFTTSISSALTSVNRYSDFYSRATYNASGVLNGMSSKNGSIKTVFSSPLSSAVTTVGGYKNSFSIAGSDLGSSFASSLSKKITDIVNDVQRRIRDLASWVSGQLRSINNAISSARAAAANAKKPNATTTPKNAELQSNVATSVKEGFEKGLQAVASYIENGMISQPTIVPVMDLSQIQNGVASINSLFASGGFNAISASMSARSNGITNADIVSAINKLENSINKIGDTYNINGITYDDGSNIANAVKMLTRAAMMERRG